jgi:phytoene dehydrogenase-like protein
VGQKSIIIIGAGMTGLAAGCYAQMNGYHSQIFEKHSIPGGLCTAWRRGDYTIDGCVDFLIGSAPGGLFHQYWKEVGLIQGRTFVHHESVITYESRVGEKFILYGDVDRLEQHMLQLSPADRDVITQFIRGVRFFMGYKPPIDAVPELMGAADGLRLLLQMAPTMAGMQKWSKITIGEFADRFQSPLLRDGLRHALLPEFPMPLLLMSLAWHALHNSDYPIGGSLPLARAIEQRYLGLGGQVHYRAPVDKILTEKGRAVGVRLADGSEQRADVIISAMDGRNTLFSLLGEEYLDAKTRAVYQNYPVFPGLLHVNLGVNRTFSDPSTMLGVEFELDQPVTIGDQLAHHLGVRIYNFDPTLAPADKTILRVSAWSNYQYWKTLRQTPAAYQDRKSETAEAVIRQLDARWPGLASEVETIDVATPTTFERYTGNWQGSTQGWKSTTQTAMKQISKTLPGLKDFYLIGQWSEVGGGLPNAVRAGRNTIRIQCKKDKIEFTTSEA